jgi:ATP-dependent Clp protease ATP-binding subunit ClpA
MGAAGLLKPMLAEGELRCIATSTSDEYKSNPDLARWFQEVHVEEPTVSETISILRGLKKKYEGHHGSRILDDAIDTAATLAARYLTDRKLPESAIDLIDAAAAAVRVARESESEPEALGSQQLQAEKQEVANPQGMLQNYENKKQHAKIQRTRQGEEGEPLLADEVGPDQVNEIVARWTRIPVTKLKTAEKKRLLQLEEWLSRIVVDQDEAVKSVSNAIRLQRSGLSNPNSPPSFLFCGASGTGKTLLTKALAEFLFDDPKAIARFDMSEYQERHSVSRLIGAPPGYLGHDSGGQLTEAIRRRPFSILLFDEIEKAAKEVLTVFLQLLDEGHITDGQGRVADARNCIVIMTSNLGAKYISDKTNEGAKRKLVMGAISEYFLPEFLNRISSTVIFRSLSEEGIRRIVNLRLGEIQGRLNSRNITLEFAEEVKDFIAKSGSNPAYGARPLGRTIEQKILPLLSRRILDGSISQNERALVVMRDDQIDVLRNDEPKERKPKK